MIIELTPTTDEKHLFVGLINDKVDAQEDT